MGPKRPKKHFNPPLTAIFDPQLAKFLDFHVILHLFEGPVSVPVVSKSVWVILGDKRAKSSKNAILPPQKAIFDPLGQL